MSDLVSIIMPNYNCEKFIAETIESVINQTYVDWELLIVDDCSTDNSVEIIKSYCENDRRIKLFINSENSGAAASRNLALREAKGRWIAFLDSDDLWHHEKLKKQIDFMERNRYSFSYTAYEQIDEQSNSLHIKVSGPEKITKKKMFDYCYPGCLTVMYDVGKVGLIQIENLKKNNDYALWLKVCKSVNCYLLNEELAFYRKRAGSISNHSKIALIKHHYRMFRIGERMNAVKAFYFTCKNMFYGMCKKLRYVKKEKE